MGLSRMTRLFSDPYKHGHRKLVMLRLMSGDSQRTLGLCKTQKKKKVSQCLWFKIVFSSLAGESSSVFLLIPSNHPHWHIGILLSHN